MTGKELLEALENKTDSQLKDQVYFLVEEEAGRFVRKVGNVNYKNALKDKFDIITGIILEEY